MLLDSMLIPFVERLLSIISISVGFGRGWHKRSYPAFGFLIHALSLALLIEAVFLLINLVIRKKSCVIYCIRQQTCEKPRDVSYILEISEEPERASISFPGNHCVASSIGG